MTPINLRVPGPKGPRYVPELWLPDRAYIPGAGPHPRHMPTHMPSVPPCPSSWPTRWRDCVPYCYGFDLYHFGYFWEAHEVWEEAWRVLPQSAPERRLVQALIFLTAACLKITCGNGRGARRHCRMALLRLESLDLSAVMLGIPIADLAMALRSLYRALEQDPVHMENHGQALPQIQLHFSEEA